MLALSGENQLAVKIFFVFFPENKGWDFVLIVSRMKCEALLTVFRGFYSVNNWCSFSYFSQKTGKIRKKSTNLLPAELFKFKDTL